MQDKLENILSLPNCSNAVARNSQMQIVNKKLWKRVTHLSKKFVLNRIINGKKFLTTVSQQLGRDKTFFLYR